ncbi:MAG: DUF1800 domain-containing protein [Blastocatellia bacterium]
MIYQQTVIHLLKKRGLPFAALLLAATLIAAVPPRAEAQTRSSQAGSNATSVSRNPQSQDGHLMRRIGFGPTAAELDLIARIGNYRYLVQQLYPDNIDDSAMQVHLDLLQPDRDDPMGYIFFPQRWYLRMVYSRRQLQEKMTLFWHEHFATSVNKAGMLPIMLAVQEEGLRRNALGNFRQMLIRITIDPAMLIWLDNNENNGRGAKPPNENYARELLQLFALGVDQLNLDGTVKRDAQGRAIPAYTESDVKEVARALTGWFVYYDEREKIFKPGFNPDWHDSGAKTFLGRSIAGRSGFDGAREVEDVVDVLMAQPAMAPFIAKIMIWKFATQTPSPQYVARVARTFAATGGDIRSTMLTLLVDREFWSERVVRSQPKTPIEQFAGALRALETTTQGRRLLEFGFVTRHLVHYPPTVFGFYPPGEKEKLLAANTVLMSDNFALSLVFADPRAETRIDLPLLVNKYGLDGKPEEVVDKLSDLLVQAPLESRTRERIVKFLADIGNTRDDGLRIALWLMLSSPDYQRN